MTAKGVMVEEWPQPRGYQYGMIATGRVLVCAGLYGTQPDGAFPGPDLVSQFDQALANVCSVVNAAGGKPEDVVRITVFLTDMNAYRISQAELGKIWRRHMHRNYPAMSVIGVKELVNPNAIVELEATAILMG